MNGGWMKDGGPIDWEDMAEKAEAERDKLRADIAAVDARLSVAMDAIERYGGIDGGHYKQWVIDQVVRALMGDEYGNWVVAMKAGEEGPETYDWDEGIAP